MKDYETACIACGNPSEDAHKFLVLHDAPALCSTCAKAICNAVYRSHGCCGHSPESSWPRPKKVTIPEELRWQVFERDGYSCKHCGTGRMLRADHIVPESKGGPTTLENLQTLCPPCNSRKGKR